MRVPRYVYIYILLLDELAFGWLQHSTVNLDRCQQWEKRILMFGAGTKLTTKCVCHWQPYKLLGSESNTSRKDGLGSLYFDNSRFKILRNIGYWYSHCNKMQCSVKHRATTVLNRPCHPSLPTFKNLYVSYSYRSAFQIGQEDRLYRERLEHTANHATLLTLLKLPPSSRFAWKARNCLPNCAHGSGLLSNMKLRSFDRGCLAIQVLNSLAFLVMPIVIKSIFGKGLSISSKASSV